MTKTTTLNQFLEFKKTSVRDTTKLQDITRYLGKFLNSTNKPLNKFTDQDIVKFLNSLDYSIGTINGIKAYIKSFLKWNFPDWSTRFRNIEKICKTQTPPKTYTPDQMLSFEEVEKIVRAENNLMWKTYWLTFFYGGFRPSECANLKWEQIFFEPQGVIIKIRTGKTQKDFIKSLPKEAENYLRELKENSISEFLFPSIINKDRPIVSRTICGRLKRISKKVLGKEVVPYQLRHSIATILYGDDTKKDDDVAQQLGHTKNMRATYKNLNEVQIKEKARNLWGKGNTKEKQTINDLLIIIEKSIQINRTLLLKTGMKKELEELDGLLELRK